MSDCCLTPSEQFFSHIVERTSYFLDNDVYFVLDYQAKLNFYNASSLKQHVGLRMLTITPPWLFLSMAVKYLMYFCNIKA